MSAYLRRGQLRDAHAATKRRQDVVRVLSPIALILAWEGASRVGLVDPRFFPAPSQIAIAAVQMAGDGALGAALLATLQRLIIGYVAGTVSGAAVGLCLGISPWLRAIVEPWLQLTYPIPKLAIYPLIVLIVGLGETPIDLLLAVAVFYIVAINTIAGVLSTKPVYFDVANEYGATFFQRVVTIALPSALPYIFAGLEISLGIAYIVLIATEFVGAKVGLGAIIWKSWQLFDVAPMYVAIAIVGILGFLSTLLIRLAGRRLAPWRNQ